MAGAIPCRLVSFASRTTEHLSSTAVDGRCSISGRGRGAVYGLKQRTFDPLARAKNVRLRLLVSRGTDIAEEPEVIPEVSRVARDAADPAERSSSCSHAVGMPMFLP